MLIPGPALRFLWKEVKKLYNVLLCQGTVALEKGLRKRLSCDRRGRRRAGTPRSPGASIIWESVALVRALATGMLFEAEPAKMKTFGTTLPRLLLRPTLATTVEKA